ncbi:hypothetical protein PVAP13_3KG406600 [Panicum virgatum]|uniref:Uncharacterized protein n=1 Tax=Panicum virgatum TaxID=38727 RepID=A0A8T0V746_PANVG|nr:hypothetical protein PVAP13_3KG406600 [Panicum virgatum]
MAHRNYWRLRTRSTIHYYCSFPIQILVFKSMLLSKSIFHFLWTPS